MSLIAIKKKRETARPLFFLFVGSMCLLRAFFMPIAKLLKTNRIHKNVYNVYKMLIYNIIIV